MSTDRLLEALLESSVPFVIVGGVAAVLHGSTLLTRDLDICISLGSRNILGLQAALKPLNPRIRAGADLVPMALDEAKANAVKNLHITTDEGRLDCLGSIKGIGDFEAVHDESVEFDLEGRACRVLGLGALIRSKEATGRPHDLETVVQLRAIRERLGD